MKKAISIVVIAVLGAATISAAASAGVWTDKGLEVEADKAIPLEGSLAINTSGIGGINCESGLKASITLKAGTTKGTVTELAPNLSKCKGTGGMGTCTVTGLHPEGLPWSFGFDGTKFTIPAFKVTYTTHGFLCPTLTITGEITATPDPGKAEIKELTLAGNVSVTGSWQGTATLSGALAPSNAGDVGTYGITVPTIWTDKGLEVEADKAIPLEGNTSFTTSKYGGINCESGLKASITLKAGTTKGTVTELAPNLSKCKGQAALAGCTVTGIHPEGLPWNFSFDGTKFTIPAYKVATTLHGFLCPPTVTVSGTVTATPDPSKAEIKELTIAGSPGFSLGGTATLSGTLAPSNAGDVGTYGITVPTIWTDKGLEVEADKAIPLEGSLAINTSGIGGINCESGLKASITLKAGTTKGTVTELAPNLSKCKGTGGMGTCTVTGLHPEGLPWSFGFDGTKFTIPAFKVTYTTHGFLCPTLTLAGEITATPDPGKAEIKELTLAGNVSVTGSWQGTATLSGALAPSNAGDVGTYGITVPE